MWHCILVPIAHHPLVLPLDQDNRLYFLSIKIKTSSEFVNNWVANVEYQPEKKLRKTSRQSISNNTAIKNHCGWNLIDEQKWNLIKWWHPFVFHHTLISFNRITNILFNFFSIDVEKLSKNMVFITIHSA